MGNKKKITKRKISILFINFVFFIMFLFIFVLSGKKYIYLNELSSDVFPWICFLIIIQMLSFKLLSISKYDYIFWYSIISYFFLFGYVFRDVFGLDSSLIWNPISNFSVKNMYDTYVFTVPALQLVVIGYLLKYNYKTNVLMNYENNSEPNNKQFKIGVLLTIVGGISRIVYDINTIAFLRIANSYSAYAYAVGSGIFDDLATLLIPGVVMIAFSNVLRENTKNRLLYFTILYFLLVMILTGSRKTHIFNIVTIMLVLIFQNRKRKRLNFFKTMLLMIVALFFVNAIIVLRDSRYVLSSFFDEFLLHFHNNGLIKSVLGETLAETSITALSIASIIQVVPAVIPYQYGMTFVRTIPSVLPIGWLVGDFFRKASSTNVINTVVGVHAGSCFIGDFYWNWGLVGGWFFLLMFGLVLSKFTEWFGSNKFKYGNAIYFSLFSQAITLVRSSFSDVFRPISYIILSIYIMDLIFDTGGYRR